MSKGAIIRGHKTITVLCPLFITSLRRSAGAGRHENIRSNKTVSKQHKSRENSREMLSKVSYKSDTMQYKLHTIESNKLDRSEVTSVH